MSRRKTKNVKALLIRYSHTCTQCFANRDLCSSEYATTLLETAPLCAGCLQCVCGQHRANGEASCVVAFCWHWARRVYIQPFSCCTKCLNEAPLTRPCQPAVVHPPCECRQLNSGPPLPCPAGHCASRPIEWIPLYAPWVCREQRPHTVYLCAAMYELPPHKWQLLVTSGR